MKRRRSPIGCLMLILLLVLAGAAGVYGYVKYMPSREHADIARIYDAGGEDKVALFLNYERQETAGLYADGQTYLPVSWVNEKLNERFYWDQGEELLVYALPEEIVKADTSADAAAKDSSGKRLFFTEGDELYLSLGLILGYTDVRMDVYESGAGKRVYVQNTWDAVSVADVRRKGAVRVRGGVKSPIMTETAKGDRVVVLETLNKWAKVVTGDGHIGYLPVNKLSDLREETPVSSFTAPVYRNISLDQKISMVWHQVTNTAANGAMEELLASARGVNVIAPTWFTLCDNAGNYESLASKSYVEKAHAKGLQVWAVLDNFSRDISRNVQSEVLLSKTSVRTGLIAKLMAEADTYGFDGINLDFEGLKEAAGVHYVQFIRELSVACRKKGLVLSVDNYVPAPYNRFYNRKEQGIVADYVIIMGYDEHYAGGDAGSVASLGYVDRGISDTLAQVPADRVICGVPFYTRLWTGEGDALSSKAMGIFAARQWIEDNGVQLTWDSELGQYYGEIQSSDGLKRLWMEDDKSLGLKMDLIKKYDLAGVSGWKLGLESADVWDVIGWEQK